MDLPTIESRLLIVLDALQDKLPCEQIDDMRDLTKAGEPGVALENLCTQLFEYDVSVLQSVRDELATLGTAMGIGADHWTRLARS
jgi:hypothetical protein